MYWINDAYGGRGTRIIIIYVLSYRKLEYTYMKKIGHVRMAAICTQTII